MDKFAEFKRAYDAYPSQDNEGYIPNRGGFKAGFFAAWEILLPQIRALEQLVKLKNHKTVYGKDKSYKNLQPLAWKTAFAVTGIEEHSPTALVSGEEKK